MEKTICPPQYLQIALDIAARIVRGQLEENSKIYGRSVMSSEYGVSPETIRRALKLLSDMEVVEIKAKSGVYIVSAENARRYIERFGEISNIRALQSQLKEIVEQHNQLSKQMAQVASSIVSLDEKQSSAMPFRNYEVQVNPRAGLVGKNIGELRFWQATGATIIAVRRGANIILSPGPYTQLLANDVVVFIGDYAAVEAVQQFINAE